MAAYQRLVLVMQFQSLTDYEYHGHESFIALELILNGEPWLYEQTYRIYRVTTRVFVNQLLYM